MTTDPFDVRLANGATGLLGVFNEAGALAAADVHVATRLARLGGEADETVMLAVALTVRAARNGSVCIELDRVAEAPSLDEDAPVDPSELPWPDAGRWAAACRRSPLVAVGLHGDPWRPLRFVDGLLYLDRYWRQEQLVRGELDARVRAEPFEVDADSLKAAASRLFPAMAADRQRLAAVSAAVRRVTVLAGGPGTGKTTTVARLLALVHALPGPRPRVALAAPTGKAAARLQEAVHAELARLGDEQRGRVGEFSASTVHRLLGFQPGNTSRFRHNRDNHLPHDVVVVDETSMVSLTLMSRLLEAVRPNARLVLVGDPDQLASVEAGAVLGDLVARPPITTDIPAVLEAVAHRDLPRDSRDREALRNCVVRLDVVHRYGPEIGALATAIRDGDAERALDVLRARMSSVEFIDTNTAGERVPKGIDDVRADAAAAGAALVAAARDGNAEHALRELERHRVLCAHRRGPYGVSRWSAEVERWVADAVPGYADEGEWYRGRPLLVTSNDYDTGLYNGDTGVVIDNGNGGVVAAFGRPEVPSRFSPSRLSDVATVHAMTVHRAQGSQFDVVSLVLPPPESPLLTRELFYTAVTRAKQTIRIVGSADAVRTAVERPIRRASGLRRVWSEATDR